MRTARDVIAEILKRWNIRAAEKCADEIVSAVLSAPALLNPWRQWQPIDTEPSDDSAVWLSEGQDVWLGTAHKDGSLRLPTRTRCKFWMPADKPAPPKEHAID